MSIDFSWVDKEEKLLKLEDDPTIKVPIQNIAVKVLFIGNENIREGEDNIQSSVKYVFRFNYVLKDAIPPSDYRYFSVADLKQCIYEKCPHYNKYNLVDISIFHINITYDKIQTDFTDDIKKIKTLWKEGNEEIRFKIPPALFIFNDIHTLYCIMREPSPVSSSPVSILKKNSAFVGDSVNRTHTKRVRVNLLNNSYLTPTNELQLACKSKRFTRHKKHTA